MESNHLHRFYKNRVLTGELQVRGRIIAKVEEVEQVEKGLTTDCGFGTIE